MNPQFKITEGTTAFLKKMREKKELTQDQMARLMKHNLTGYNQIEKGHKCLTLIQIWILADVLNMSKADVINGICGADPCVHKDELEKLQALFDAALQENSALKDKVIGLMEGRS